VLIGGLVESQTHREARVDSLAQLLVLMPMFILGSIWYIAITALLFMIWRELRMMRLQ
jgi:hypothetical protein